MNDENTGETAKEVTELIINKNAAARVTNQLKRNLYKELVQTAAVAVAWAEALREEESKIHPLQPVANAIQAESEDPIISAARNMQPATAVPPEKFVQCTMTNAQGIQCILNRKHVHQSVLLGNATPHDYGLLREPFRAPERAVENPLEPCIKCGHARSDHYQGNECINSIRIYNNAPCRCTKFEGKRDALNSRVEHHKPHARDVHIAKFGRPPGQHVKDCGCDMMNADPRCNP